MKILIPTPLRQYVGKRDAINVQAVTVNDALAKLTGEHPELKRHLFTDEGKLRAFVNLYLNDDDVRYLEEKENTPVNDGDSLSIIPSIAGGKGDRAILRSGDRVI
jgi:molybdopterin converting factor small subunit